WSRPVRSYSRVLSQSSSSNDLDALLLAHGANAEERVDVDQANAADLHIVPRDLVSAPDEHVVTAPGDVDDVIRDETVPPLHQIEHAFALADPGAAAKQQSDAEDVGEGAVDRGARGERVVEKWLEPPVELRGLEARADDGNALVPGQLHQLLRHLLPLGDDHTRQVVREKRLNGLTPAFRVERGEIRDFGFAKDMNAIGADKARRVSR